MLNTRQHIIDRDNTEKLTPTTVIASTDSNLKPLTFSTYSTIRLYTVVANTSVSRAPIMYLRLRLKQLIAEPKQSIFRDEKSNITN